MSTSLPLTPNARSARCPTANDRGELTARARLLNARIGGILARAGAAFDADDVPAGAIYLGRTQGLITELRAILEEAGRDV